MSNVLPVEDLSKTYLEHAMVINNFVIKIGSQIKDSLCRVFGDGVQYEWRESNDSGCIHYLQLERSKEYFFYRYSAFCDGGLIQCYREIRQARKNEYLLQSRSF